MENDKDHPRVLIEDWFPFEEIGIECQRERTGEFVPLNRIHLWWARRPLICSRASLIGSILPTQAKKSFFKFLSIDQNLKKSMANWEKLKSEGKTPKGIASSRAFTKNLTAIELENLKDIIQNFWKKKDIRILDPMAGGGSIPFESIRLNLTTFISDLNPVATICNYAGIYYPNKLKNKILPKLNYYANLLINDLRKKLEPYYYCKKGQKNEQYLWVRTIKCPNPMCNLEVPLSPNWDLSSNPIIILKVNPPIEIDNEICNFKVIQNPSSNIIENNKHTVRRGIGRCPRCEATLSGDYIKSEAQDGRMGHQLVTIIYKEKLGKRNSIIRFRDPEISDLKSIIAVNNIIQSKIENWKKEGIFIDEPRIKGFSDRSYVYGVDYWYKMFNNRQLLANMTILESIINLKKELFKKKELNNEEIKALITYFQIALDKLLDYNCISSIWQKSYQRIIHLFNRHDFAFNYFYVEMDVVRKGYDWSVGDTIKIYEKIVDLIGNSEAIYQINKNSAHNLSYIETASIDLVLVDPPYYDNVMYAELSDFFYVWMKKGLKDLYPDLFNDVLTDKDSEAVANPTMFEGLGESKKKLAKQDYESKMLLCFKEMYRVLQYKGVLTIMFTHKSTDAWDTLTMSLMEAGFEIRAAWPVHTEFERSLHIAKKNAVKTTIILICRKRIMHGEELWWEDDVLPSIKKIILNKVKEFRKLGIDGVDLFISCFGPALKEFSKSYPVKNIAGEIVRAEEAIEAARRVVIDITLQDIIKGKSYNIDPVSKFYLTAWHFFKARSFPFDEARRLALSIGINIDDLKTYHKLLNKKSGDVELLLPKDREKNGTINVDNPKDNGILINAVHIALLAYEQGGQKLYENVIEKLRRNTDKSFRLYMETLFNILPDVKDLSKNLPEKKILGEILMVTEEKITPKGGKITDFIE